MKIELSVFIVEPDCSALVLWKFKNPIVIIHQNFFVCVCVRIVGRNKLPPPPIWKFEVQFKTS